jgi:hypothetical protein
VKGLVDVLDVENLLRDRHMDGLTWLVDDDIESDDPAHYWMLFNDEPDAVRLNRLVKVQVESAEPPRWLNKQHTRALITGLLTTFVDLDGFDVDDELLETVHNVALAYTFVLEHSFDKGGVQSLGIDRVG